MYDLVKIGERIKQARGSVTQKEVAEEFCVDRSYVGSIEQGKSKPSLAFLAFISKRFNISLDWIIFGEEINNSRQVISLREKDEEIELIDMIDYLKKTWNTGDRDIQGWLKVQFRKAFPDFEEEQKKPLAAAAEGSTTKGA